MNTPPPHPSPAWHPPSDHLIQREGVWQGIATTPVSYPAAGNDACLQVEETSYWFRHRLDCILAVLHRFPAQGTLFDIGGGNGFVARGLQDAGITAALLEPGPGARNALRRGVRHVIQSTMDDARFHPGSLPAAGAFDVVEHIKDDLAFLQSLRRSLCAGGRFYCTVPAYSILWSADDVAAGHYRRYSGASLRRVLQAAGFQVEYLTPIFSWLVAPVFLARALPSRVGLRSTAKAGSNTTIQSDHSLSVRLQPVVASIHDWEARQVAAGRRLSVGTSLLCVARSQGS